MIKDNGISHQKIRLFYRVIYIVKPPLIIPQGFIDRTLKFFIIDLICI